MKNPLENVIGGMLMEQMQRIDKYRHDCIHCVKVLDIPMDLCFCSCKTFPKGVTAIIQCPADCNNYFKEEPCV
jgi:hypothetical protein